MLANRKFGVEIEAFMPAGTTYGQLAETLRRAGIAAYCDGYTHAVTAHWKLVQDGSLAYNRREGVELVSPPLRGEAGLAEAVRAIGVMKAFGCTVSVKCGLHVHVDAADLSLTEMKRLAMNYAAYESAFDAIVPPSRRADLNHFVLSNRTGFGGFHANESVNAAIACYSQAHSIEDLCTKVAGAGRGWGYSTRYRKLNFMAYLPREGRPGFKTVEFRQHSGTVEGDKLENWVRLCVAFVEQSRTSRPRRRPSSAPHRPGAELEMLMRFLELPRASVEFYRARRRAFTERAMRRQAPPEAGLERAVA